MSPVTPLDFNSQAAAEERSQFGLTQGQQRYAAGYRQGDAIQLANVIYGEVASEDAETMKMVGSSILNRLEDGGTVENFGTTVNEVVTRPGAYNAVTAEDGNANYDKATTQKFDNDKEEKAYKRALQIAGGLLRGTIQRHEAQFFFTKDEMTKLKRSRKKDRFDFKKVVDTGKKGKYQTFSY